MLSILFHVHVAAAAAAAAGEFSLSTQRSQVPKPSIALTYIRLFFPFFLYRYLAALDQQHYKWLNNTDMPVLRISTEVGEDVQKNVDQIREFIDKTLVDNNQPMLSPADLGLRHAMAAKE